MKINTYLKNKIWADDLTYCDYEIHKSKNEFDHFH